MADSIQFRRGLRSAVKPLPVGMPGFIEDEERLVIGKGDGTNTELPSKADIDNINSQMAEKVSQSDLDNTNANIGDKAQLNTANKSSIVSAVNEIKNKTDVNQSSILNVNTNLQNTKADKTYVDSKVTSVASGSPDKTFATLADLNTAYPAGDSKNKLVASDGHIYNWNGLAWTDTGIQYQSTGIASKSITPVMTTFQQIDLSQVTMEGGYYIDRTAGFKVANTSEYYASDFIDLPEGLKFVIKTCTTNDFAGLAFYNKDNQYISGIITGYSTSTMTETEFTMPQGSSKIRFSCVGSDKLSNVSLSIKSNVIDVADKLTEVYGPKIASLENKSDVIFSDMFESYFYKTGTDEDIPELFKNINSYGAPENGTVTLGDTVVDVTTVSGTNSGGVGFYIKLPNLTTELIKRGANSLQVEFDVAMQTPIALTYNIGVYAMKKSTKINAISPLVIANMSLTATASQHVSKKLIWSYDNIINNVIGEDVTLDDIDYFAIFINRISVFSDNIIRFSNIYLKRNSLPVEQNFTDLLAKTDEIHSVVQKLYDNYNFPQDDMFKAMTIFCPNKGTVVIDTTDKVITINNTTDLTSGSAGIVFRLPDFYEALKENGVISIDFRGKSNHNGHLLVQLFPCTATGNFVNPYQEGNYMDTGLGVDIGINLTITMADLQAFFTSHSYDISTLDHFAIYIRANSISDEFNCTVTDLEFNAQLLTKTLQDKMRLMTNDSNTLVLNSENPLDVIKRDGGLFPIFHKVGYIGDSLSSGEHEYTKSDGTTGFIDLFDYSYGQAIAKATGTTALNFSSGGLTATTWLSGFSTQAFETPENICQAYVIYLGTNDVDPNKNPNGMGSVESVDINNYNNNDLTFAGRYATIIQKIKEVQPKAKIFCCTLPKAPSHINEWEPNPIIRQIVALFSNVYLLDLFTYADTITNDYRLGFHLTSAGYQIFAWQVMSYIDYLIRKYPSEFKEVAFIGTDYHHN